MSGFTFDGRHSSELSLIVTKKEVPITPAIENRFQDISGVDGAWDYGVSYGPRVIEMDCVILADTTGDLNRCIRLLAAWLDSRKGVRSLVFDDDQSKQFFARLGNQVPLQTAGSMGTFTLQMICLDPFIYDTHRTDFSSIVFPFMVTHLGTHNARPILTITHGGGEATIEHTRPDGTTVEFCLKESAQSGVYVMDCKQFTIVKEGINVMNDCAGPFFALSAGENTFAVTGAISQIDISFFNTWI